MLMAKASADDLEQMPLRLKRPLLFREPPKADPQMKAPGLKTQDDRALGQGGPDEAARRSGHQLKTRSRSNFITKTIRKMMKASPM